MLSVSAPAYARYLSRVADVEGVRRATVVTTELRSREVAIAKMPAELAEHTIRTPYGGEPFAWDAGEQAIVFVGKEPGERGRHVFNY